MILLFVKNAKNSVVITMTNSGIVRADQQYVLTFIQAAKQSAYLA